MSGAFYCRGCTIFAPKENKNAACHECKHESAAAAAADTRGRSGHGHWQRDRLLRPPHQQAPALLLARPLGRGDGLRLVRRALSRSQPHPHGRMGPPRRRGRYRVELLRRNPLHRHHRPACPLGREPARGPQRRGDGAPAPQSEADAHGAADGSGHRHPQLPGRHRHLHLGGGQPHARYRHRRGHRHPQHSRRHRRIGPGLLRHGRPPEGLPPLAALGTGRTGRRPHGLARAHALHVGDAHGLPAAREYGETHTAIYGVVAGMAVMAVSLLLLN